MRLVFVRHTETEGNVKHLIYGHKDYPLTEKGEEQLEAVVAGMADFLTGKIVTSPLGRARVLAESLAETYDQKLVQNAALEEMNLGILEGYTVDEAQVKYPDLMGEFYKGEPEWEVPDGESYLAFENRVVTAMDQLVDEGDDVVVVAHGGVIRTALEYLLEAEPGGSWILMIENGAIAEVVIEEGAGKLRSLVNLRSS